MSTFTIGLDLGQAQDYTALTVIHTTKRPVGEPYEMMQLANPLFVRHDGYNPMHRARVQPAETVHHLRHIERYPLGTPYPDIARSVREIMHQEPLRGACTLAVDATGAGRPVVDMLREAGVKPLRAVSIHGGGGVTWEGGFVRVPKRDLVSNLQVLLQNERIKFAAGLQHLPLLVSELENFKAKINIATGQDTYEAWREKEHDDLVLALALSCWEAERTSSSDWSNAPRCV